MTRCVLLRQAMPALLALAASAMLHAEPSVPTSRTQCFGRYLVDIPVPAVLVGTGNKYISAEIKQKNLSLREFEKAISDRENALKSPKRNDDQKLQKVMFAYSESRRLLLSYAKVFGGGNYEIDTFGQEGGKAFLTKADAISSQYIGDILSKYQAYLRNVRYRQETNIPKDPGFCFENGFVANDGKKPQYELVTLAFELKDHPDVHIVVESEVLFSPTDSLLQRSAKAGWLSLFDGMHTLRKGTRSVNGLAGEEVLNRYRSDQGGKAHKFRWETLGELANPLKPDIYVDFQTGFKPGGGSVDSSLSDQEAIALFDQIVNSVRIRPTGDYDKIFDTEPTVLKASKVQAIDSASERGQHD